MAYRILLRRDNLINWNYNEPVLLSGEAGYVTDTGRLKIGDGQSNWSALPYLNVGLSEVNENIVPNEDGTYDIGSSSLRWRNGYFGTVYTYSGTIYNSEGIGLVNIPVGLYYRTKSSGGAYSLFQTYTTNSTGVFSISTSLDITVYDFQVTISSLSVSNPEIADANFFTDKVLSQSFTAKDYYRMNTNGNSALTVTDVFLVYQKRNGAGWPAGVPAYRIFTQAEWSTINTSSLNLMSTYAGTQSVTLTNPTAGGSASFYLVRTGLRQ